VAYEIWVRNVGRVSAAHVLVEDELPPGSRVTQTTPPAAIVGARLSWTVDALPAGQEIRFKVEARLSAAGELTGTATVTAAVSTAIRTRVSGAALDVALEGPDAVSVGQTAAFKIRIANQDSRRQKKLVLLVRLPEGLKHPAGKEIEADLGELGAGETRKIDLKVNALQTGRCTVEAFVTAPGGAQARAEALLVVSEPLPLPAPGAPRASGLTLWKRGEQFPVQGVRYKYQVQVANHGPAGLAGVTVLDRLPEGLEFLAATDGGTFDVAARRVEWRIGGLAPNQARTVWLEVLARTPGEQSIEVIALDGDGHEERLTGSMQINPR
jgi:uncharacterized repeat protein (TIGR01451 family)